jgi:hypothetical protein
MIHIALTRLTASIAIQLDDNSLIFRFFLGGTCTFFGATIISSTLLWAVSASLHFLNQSLE